jgi:hypothetical protein
MSVTSRRFNRFNCRCQSTISCRPVLYYNVSSFMLTQLTSSSIQCTTIALASFFVTPYATLCEWNFNFRYRYSMPTLFHPLVKFFELRWEPHHKYSSD